MKTKNSLTLLLYIYELVIRHNLNVCFSGQNTTYTYYGLFWVTLVHIMTLLSKSDARWADKGKTISDMENNGHGYIFSC